VVAKAKFSLAEVFRIIDSCDLNRIWFSAPSRSVNEVIKAYAGSTTPKNYEDAVKFILGGIKTLDDGAFVERVVQWGDPKCIADVYGLIYDGKPWYVKFRIEDDGVLDEISFHPPEKELKTISGKIISKGAKTP